MIKKGFTLVELLAVIVILAVILVIAVPKITSSIDSSRLGSIESSARLILESANSKYLDNTILESSTNITCSDVVDSVDEYSTCNLNYNDGTYEVSLIGDDDGKFAGYYCEGNKNDLTCKKRDKTKKLVMLSTGYTSNISSSTIDNYFYEASDGTVILDDGCVYDGNTLTSVCELKVGDDTIATATIKFSSYISTEGWTIDDSGISEDGYEVEEDTTITITYGGCIAKGTKITLADGTYKNVEDLEVGEMIMTYDFFTGNMVPRELISKLSGTLYDGLILTVKLDNGNEVKIVTDEDVFNMDTKEYVRISKDTVNESIGMNIMVYDNGNRSSAKIIDIVEETTDVEFYSLYTSSSLNYVANDIVLKYAAYYPNMVFTIDDNYKIDYDKLEEDINTYGIYTYDDLKDIATEKEVDDLLLLYGKIIVNKGYATEEQMYIDMRDYVLEVRRNK